MRFRDITTRRLLVAAATFTLLAGAGCANLSAYKQQYYVQVEKNKELKEELREKVEIILERDDMINHLEGKAERADGALTAQGQRERAEEERKRVLLALLQESLKGTPSEAELRGGGYVVTTRFSFEPGKALLDATAKRDLKKIAAALNEGFPNATLMVAGHADKTPIVKSTYASNWHLSGERARSVMEFLVTQCKIPPEKTGYAGYGEFRPVADNKTPQGRERNRRIEIIVTP